MSRRGFLRASTAAAAGLAVSGCKSTKETSLEEKNKAISRRLIEDGWGPGDLDVFDEIISPDFTGYGLQGLEAYKQMCVAGPFTALSERQYTIHSQIAKGDQVGTHFTVQAIQTGPLNGIPPSNEKIQSDAMLVHRIVDGKIVSEQQFSDMLTILMQIGAVPSWIELAKQAQSSSASAEANKALVRRYVEELWNQHNTDLVDEIVAPGFVYHKGHVTGRGGHRQWIAGVQNLWPDLEIEIQEMIAEGDKVAYWWTASPTTEWVLFGIPPESKPTKVSAINLIRIEDGMIAETWQEWNTFDVYQQLGGVSAQETAQENPQTQEAMLELSQGTVQANGLSISYLQGGEGPPLMLLHGFTQTGHEWDPFLNELGKHYTVILPDLPGHGGSEAFTGSFSHKEAGRCMLALMDELGIDSIRGIGHSSGSVILLQMAAEQPNRIESMVLVAGAHRLCDSGRQILGGFAWDSLPEEQKGFFLQLHPGGEEQVKVIFVQLQGLADNEDDFDLSTADLAGIGTKTLLVWGDRDPIYALTDAVEMYQSMPNAGLWVVPGREHYSLWPAFGGSADAESIFCPVVIEWLGPEEA